MQITFLTREGCVNTPVMKENLDAALRALFDSPPKFEVVDQGSLKPEDARRGYATPTVLVDGHDLFGTPEPSPPFPPPS